jgi:hypothetical protein
MQNKALVDFNGRTVTPGAYHPVWTDSLTDDATRRARR